MADPSRMNEDDLLNAVVDLARLMGILVHHCRPARTKGPDGKDRWVTPIKGDKGFTDLVLAGRRGVLFRELKTQKGRLSPEQNTWLARLTSARQDAATWRPSDLTDGRIHKELKEIR